MGFSRGGHVEIDEHPKDAAIRELMEELHIPANFWCEHPFFITSSVIVGLTPEHIDITLWYVFQGEHTKQYEFDAEEFNSINWFDFDDVFSLENIGPDICRFIKKFRKCH